MMRGFVVPIRMDGVTDEHVSAGEAYPPAGHNYSQDDHCCPEPSSDKDAVEYEKHRELCGRKSCRLEDG